MSSAPKADKTRDSSPGRAAPVDSLTTRSRQSPQPTTKPFHAPLTIKFVNSKRRTKTCPATKWLPALENSDLVAAKPRARRKQTSFPSMWARQGGTRGHEVKMKHRLARPMCIPTPTGETLISQTYKTITQINECKNNHNDMASNERTAKEFPKDHWKLKTLSELAGRPSD